jgi:hypothetical protein
VKASIALFFILLFIGLSINKEPVVQPEILNEEQDNQYLQHAESSERLLNIMEQISLVANSQNSEEMSGFTEESMTNLIEAVEELLFYAELMSLKVPVTDLEESKNVIFSALASKLYTETLNLQQLTQNYDLHVIDNSQEHLIHEAFNRLSQTCSACHQLFRDN